MLGEVNNQITYITVDGMTYIYHRSNMVFTLVSTDFKISTKQLKSKEDFKELYKGHEEGFKLLGIEMPSELKQWFENTYISIIK